jgi:hypothetical protein
MDQFRDTERFRLKAGLRTAEKMYPSKAVDIVGKRLSKALEYCPIPFVTC